MKYEPKYNEIDAIQYKGYNIQEMSNFCQSYIVGFTDKEMIEYLNYLANGGVFKVGDYLVKPPGEKPFPFVVIDEDSFNALFKEED